ncbi:hypothetical protein [Hymenobacter aerophilus]|uniref:hypothetical protein n=1 Tax=Hymenobacter aerophilus TaxID=119644 RepID=UPI00037ED979|nr:hypothetical protein [Hymenobacter aerophilus]
MEASPVYGDTIQAWNRTLTANPLRALTEEDLRIFYFKALTTWGNLSDFRHFLPRILELLTTFSGDWEEWVALNKLNYGHWQTWSEAVQKAMRRYLRALWHEVLISDVEMVDVVFGEYTAGIAEVYPDFGQLLQHWFEVESPYKVPRLVYFVNGNSKQLLKKQRLSMFTGTSEQGPLFFSWLTSPALIEYLTADFFRNPSSAYAAELSAVIQMLEVAAKK